MRKQLKKAYPFLILAALAGIAVYAVDGLVSIQIMRAIDAVMAKDKSLMFDHIKTMLLLAGVFVPTTLLLAYLKGIYKKKAIVTAKSYYIDKIFDKEINQFQAENTALYLSALTNDVSNVEMNYIDGIYEVVLNTMNFIVGIVVIAYVSPVALAVGILLGLLGLVVSVIMGKPLQLHQSHRSEYYKDYTIYIKEFLGAFNIIKSNNLADKVRSDFYGKSEKIQEKGYIIDKIVSYISATQNFIMMSIMYGLLAFSVWMALKGNLTLGGVILIVNNMEKIMFPLMQISEWLPKVQSTKGIFSRIDEVLEKKVDHEETLPVGDLNDRLSFDDVSFSYDQNVVLEEVVFEFDKGKKYLIVGPSGGGKSTILKLARKYFNPSKGQIKYDALDLKNVLKESYFKQISNIEQAVFIFEDTLRNNLTLYKQYDDAAIAEAIRKAGLSDFISKSEEGLERMLYDNGKNISGGEKSRIAIARGLLQNANILILDEAFASLDGHVAREIEETILNLKDVTVVNVSHVLFEQTKEKYDKIFLVKNKKVYAI